MKYKYKTSNAEVPNTLRHPVVLVEAATPCNSLSCAL